MEQKNAVLPLITQQHFLDLGVSPLANSFVSAENSYKMEPFYPLHTFVCHSCLLVQLDEFESPHNIFHDYLYFSSYSSSWLLHAKQYVEMAIKRFYLKKDSRWLKSRVTMGTYYNTFKKKISKHWELNLQKCSRNRYPKGIPTEVNFSATT